MSRTLRFAVVLVAAVAAAAPSLRAQASVSVAAGASAPTGTFGDVHNLGYNLLLGIGMNTTVSPLGFRVEGMFDEFDRSSPSTSKTRVLGVTANGVLNLSGVLGPYAIGGAGLYNTRRTNNLGDSSDLGFNIGGGFRFGLTGFSAFAEARYYRVGDGVATFVPISFGLTF